MQLECPSIDLEQEAIEFFLGYWDIGEDDWFTWRSPDLGELIEILEAKGLLTITRKEPPTYDGYMGYGTLITPKGEAFLRCCQPFYSKD